MVRYQDDLVPLMQPIDSVKQNPDNYNQGDLEAISESIEVNGMYRPIYVSRQTNLIVAGNHTWHACKELGAEVIPVIWLDGDQTQMVKTMIADNRTAALARPDESQLLSLLTTLHTADDLTGTGYKEFDLQALEAVQQIPADLDADYKSWPTLCFQVPPHVRRAFMSMTDAATGDRERFELLLRLAGWEG
jgi:hypothetical protein